MNMRFTYTGLSMLLLFESFTACEQPEAKAEPEKIGVLRCDEYISNLERCLQTVEDGALRHELEINRSTWAEAAKTRAGKAGLQPACWQAGENVQKRLESLGCTRAP